MHVVKLIPHYRPWE